MDKKFLVAGTSTLKGKIVARFANGTAKARTKVLVKNGDTDIVLVDLTKSLTKAEALAEILATNASAFNADQIAALTAAAGGSKLTTKAAKTTVAKATKTVKKAAKAVKETVVSADKKAAVKAANLETIKAAAKAMQKRTRKAKVVDTTEAEVANVDVEDADFLDGLRGDLIPGERGARLAEEI